MSLDTLTVDLACTVIRLSETSIETTPLVEQMESYLAQNRYLVLDAGGINFNTTGIGELMNLVDGFHKAWEGRACYVAMINLTPSAHALFSISKLDQIFPKFESISEALDYFSKDDLPDLKATQ